MTNCNFTARIDLRDVDEDQAAELRTGIQAAVAGVVGEAATINGQALVMRSRPPARQAIQEPTE